jgi:PII-like signaling protein
MRSEAKKLLLIIVEDVDRWEDQPLHEAIVRSLRKLGVAGVTVWSGIEGYGASGLVHHKGLFGVSDEKPIIIAAVDDEMSLRAAVPTIVPMVDGGIVLLQDAEVFTVGEEQT